jgi:nucleoside-diphosphate-sugar epimerase
VYKLRSYQLSVTVGKEAAKRGVKAYVEMSTGTVYNSNKSPQKESDKTSKPHTKQAKWKLAAEEELAKIANLNLCVLRMPHVYGPYVGRWLGTQLALARLYQERSKDKPETMKYLWSSDMRVNTLHVEDAASAAWQAAAWRATNDSIPGQHNTRHHGRDREGCLRHRDRLPEHFGQHFCAPQFGACR